MSGTRRVVRPRATTPPDGEELFSRVGTFLHMAQALRRSMLDLARRGRPFEAGPSWAKMPGLLFGALRS